MISGGYCGALGQVEGQILSCVEIWSRVKVHSG